MTKRKKLGTIEVTIIGVVIFGVIYYSIDTVSKKINDIETDKTLAEKMITEAKNSLEFIQIQDPSRDYIDMWFWNVIDKIGLIKDDDDQWFNVSFITKHGKNAWYQRCKAEESPPSETIKAFIALHKTYELFELKKIDEKPILIFMNFKEANVNYDSLWLKGTQRCALINNSLRDKEKAENDKLNKRLQEVEKYK